MTLELERAARSVRIGAGQLRGIHLARPGDGRVPFACDAAPARCEGCLLEQSGGTCPHRPPGRPIRPGAA
jgi:hypothetical protein